MKLLYVYETGITNGRLLSRTTRSGRMTKLRSMTV